MINLEALAWVAVAAFYILAVFPIIGRKVLDYHGGYIKNLFVGAAVHMPMLLCGLIFGGAMWVMARVTA